MHRLLIYFTGTIIPAVTSVTSAAMLTAMLTAVLTAVACADSASQSNDRQFDSKTIRVGKTPGSIETADFNHDGFPDLAIANDDDSSVIVLLGDGQGQFSPAPGSPYKVYARPHTHGNAVADFNGDGHLDMATDDWGEDKISIIFGDSTLNFSHQTFYSVGKRPYQRLRTADVNQDGKPDLITTNLESNNSTVLLGQGDGSFKEAPCSPFPCGDAPFAVATGDLNGDGHPDLAIADAPTITSESKGRDGLYILLGDGAGHFQPLKGSPFHTGKSPSRLAIGDLNGDGVNDVAVTNQADGTVMILLNK